MLLSLFVLDAVPRLIRQARAHQLAAHRATVRGLLIPGFFTFTSGRRLEIRLFGCMKFRTVSSINLVKKIDWIDEDEHRILPP